MEISKAFVEPKFTIGQEVVALLGRLNGEDIVATGKVVECCPNADYQLNPAVDPYRYRLDSEPMLIRESYVALPPMMTVAA